MTYPKNLGFRMFIYILMLIVEYNMHFVYKSYKKNRPLLDGKKGSMRNGIQSRYC